VTAQELIAKQIAETEFMLGKVFEGLTEETAGQKVGNLMSAKETGEHLCECYLAAKAEADGTPFEWGKTTVADRSWDGLQQEMKLRRAAAVDALLAKGDDAAIMSANNLIVGHDHYHVGQMCAVRRALDPEWDAYSIYG
jgi:hypothetical protein